MLQLALSLYLIRTHDSLIIYVNSKKEAALFHKVVENIALVTAATARLTFF